MKTAHLLSGSLYLLVCLIACGADDENELGDVGDACDGSATECQENLACDPLASGGGYVCGHPVTIRGEVADAVSPNPIAEARVVALSAEGIPVGTVALTDSDGRYTIEVPAPRTEDGSVDASASWTLNVAAQGYEIFPAGPRPAIAITISQAADAEIPVLEAANTSVGLLPLPDADQRPHQIRGQVTGDLAGGTLVVAEGNSGTAPYGIAAPNGNFVLFNVPEGTFELAGYRRGQQLERTSVDTSQGSVTDVQMVPSSESLAVVSGSVNIVNAPGGSATSVVLVPRSVFDSVQERGPVPLGLRSPNAPESPNVSSAFEIPEVPRGEYFVLAAFENDELVRDPDEGIGGTTLQDVSTMQGGSVTMSESFKITEHLELIGPGASGVEEVSGAVRFEWADDSSEDYYHLSLYTALGDLVWEDPSVPGVSGSATVGVGYAGPDLMPGMVYQFRVTSFRDRQQGPSAISRTEDLRGVFQYMSQ